MKAKGILLASVAGTVVAPAVATAADMPVKAAAPVAAPVVVAPSWAGLYIGVHAGAAWNRAKVDQPDAYYAPIHLKDTKAGFIGGGLIGYNLQSGSLVYGVEADISGLSAKATDSDIVSFGPGGNGGPALDKRTLESDINWLVTLRARLGLLATQNLLVYVTGGVAWANIENKLTQRDQPFIAPGSITWSDKKTRTGPVVGGGFDYMFSPNWIGRVEGLWANFGKHTVRDGKGNSFGPAGNQKTTTFKNNLAVVRAALMYKF